MIVTGKQIQGCQLWNFHRFMERELLMRLVNSLLGCKVLKIVIIVLRCNVIFVSFVTGKMMFNLRCLLREYFVPLCVSD